MNIFVGNFPFDATEADLQLAFERFGKVAAVIIVKEKKGVKSRGFGFVEMPDEREANGAILALNSKDFMGRPLNVSPARPKAESDRLREEKKMIRLEAKKSAQRVREEEAKSRRVFTPDFKRKSGYKTGRRTRSFLAKNKLTGAEEKPKSLWQRNKENPMRWRKKSEDKKPWQKNRSELKPWQKSQGKAKPWRKGAAEGKSGAPRKKGAY